VRSRRLKRTRHRRSKLRRLAGRYRGGRAAIIYFTGDTHFGDLRVLRIDRKPFPGIGEHDEALIAKWNAIVTRSDEAWQLEISCPGASGRPTRS
jgi:hypothetical protein